MSESSQDLRLAVQIRRLLHLRVPLMALMSVNCLMVLAAFFSTSNNASADSAAANVSPPEVETEPAPSPPADPEIAQTTAPSNQEQPPQDTQQLVINLDDPNDPFVSSIDTTIDDEVPQDPPEEVPPTSAEISVEIPAEMSAATNELVEKSHRAVAKICHLIARSHFRNEKQDALQERPVEAILQFESTMDPAEPQDQRPTPQTPETVQQPEEASLPPTSPLPAYTTLTQRVQSGISLLDDYFDSPDQFENHLLSTSRQELGEPNALRSLGRAYQRATRPCGGFVSCLSDSVASLAKYRASEQSISNTPLIDGLVLVNPQETGGEVHYLLDDEVYTLLPGESHQMGNAQPRILRFHRGGDFGDVERELSQGSYRFEVSQQGWQLSPE